MPLQYPSLDAAIGTAEGFGNPGSIPALANNPGDIIAGPFATAHGATGSITAANGQQIATFPSVDQGLAATDALVANNYAGGSITDLAQHWLGSSATPTDVSNWASNVSNALGVPVSTPVTSLSGGGSPSSSGVAAPATPGWAQQAFNYLTTGSTSGLGGYGITWGRVAAFVLGLIVLAGAVYLFKPAQQVINSTVRAAGRAAAV